MVFNALEKEDINKIIDIELAFLIKRIKDLGYELKLSKKLKIILLKKDLTNNMEQDL